MQKLIFYLSILIFVNSIQSFGQSASIGDRAAGFLQSLSAGQRQKAQYRFDSDERFNWHFIPKRDRHGIMINELSIKQREAAFSILKYYLSNKGYEQTVAITQLESLLQELENRSSDDWYRDPARYSFLFFGNPSDTSRWGWRFEGHHISFNFSSINGNLISGTPGFMGSNPAVVLTGPKKGQEILKSETELGFALLHSLNPEQLSIAISREATPGEIITGNSRKVILEKREGISFGSLNKEQKQIFIQLLSVYLERYTKKFAEDWMKEIENAGLNELYFLWA